MLNRGFEYGMSPYTKGVASVWECSQDGLTCVASTASGCVKAAGALSSSNGERSVRASDAGHCGATWNLCMDDLGLAGRQGVSLPVLNHDYDGHRGAKSPRSGRRVTRSDVESTHVFFHDFIEAGHERGPLEDFDGLLDRARLRHGEIHEHLE